MPRYEFLEHTADIGIKIYGEDLKALFINAGWAMFDIIADLEKVETKSSINIQAEAVNYEELLVAWLRELLYQYSTEEILFKEFDIEELNEGQIKAKAKGEIFDSQKHRLKTDIKAVTYHELKIEKQEDHWVAEVIFDV